MSYLAKVLLITNLTRQVLLMINQARFYHFFWIKCCNKSQQFNILSKLKYSSENMRNRLQMLFFLNYFNYGSSSEVVWKYEAKTITL
jgi:hypothetical protein